MSDRVLLTDAALLALTVLMSAGCVPSEPSPSADGGVTAVAARPMNTGPKPSSPPQMPRVQAPLPTVAPSAGPPITSVFEDHFDRAELGPDWFAAGPGWSIKNGRLCGQGARNRGVWLERTLPLNARIEFDAMSESPDGDIKAEYWGDGRSGATSVSYTNATSYLTIFGGWKNQFHVLARVNEHAPDRLQIRVDPSSTREQDRPVIPGRTYGFRVERADGKTISWWVDGNLMHRLEDPQPLSGPGHDHFGFNDCEVPVCFDNVKITPL